jgi:hypothetical protein
MHSKASLSGLIATLMGLVVVAGGVGGCVTTASVRTEPRDSVRFTSATSAQTFYEAYLAKYYFKSTQGSFAIGVPLPYQHREMKTDNISFNAAVSVADADHDGVITDEEARGYNEKVKLEREDVVAAAPAATAVKPQ